MEKLFVLTPSVVVWGITATVDLVCTQTPVGPLPSAVRRAVKQKDSLYQLEDSGSGAGMSHPSRGRSEVGGNKQTDHVSFL